MFFDKPKNKSAKLGVIEAPKAEDTDASSSLFSKNVFRQKLSELIKNPPKDAIQMVITPKHAEIIIDDYNKENRPVGQVAVSRYSDDMRQGKWSDDTRIPILFSDRKLLIDGQKRLMAVIKSNVPVKFDVVFGVRHEVFWDLDRGQVRTGPDMLALKGAANYPMAASVTRVIIALGAKDRTGHAGIGATKYNPQQIFDAYAKTGELGKESVQIAMRCKRAGIKQPSASGGVFYYAAKKNKRLAEIYFEKIITGLGHTHKLDPAHMVREYINRKGYDPYRAEVINLLIEGWNAEVAGKKLKSVHPLVQQEFE